MRGHAGKYCIYRDDDGQLYRRTQKGKRLDLFPMKTAIISHDSHGHYVVGTLMWEALGRGRGGKEAGKAHALELQPDIKHFEYEYRHYIPRCGFVVTYKRDVYVI